MARRKTIVAPDDVRAAAEKLNASPESIRAVEEQLALDATVRLPKPPPRPRAPTAGEIVRALSAASVAPPDERDALEVARLLVAAYANVRGPGESPADALAEVATMLRQRSRSGMVDPAERIVDLVVAARADHVSAYGETPPKKPDAVHLMWARKMLASMAELYPDRTIRAAPDALAFVLLGEFSGERRAGMETVTMQIAAQILECAGAVDAPQVWDDPGRTVAAMKKRRQRHRKT